MKSLSFFFILTLLVACKSDTTVTNSSEAKVELGSVDLQVKGSPQAKAAFEKGLLYLHSFEYFDAKLAFQEAQKLDPNMGMAYWGELMSYNHGLWARQLYKEAQEVIKKMGDTSKERQAKLGSPLEQDLFKAMELLYGMGTKNERDAAYRSYMKELYAKYPDSHEVATFYAISIIGGTDKANRQSDYDRSAEILSKVLEQNEDHPGALHYFIHSRDYPEHAHLAKAAADRYAKVAPDAAHALHMPSHIYVALGAWNDVVNSNIDSWNASVNKNKRYPAKPTSYHAFNWLQYGLLQRGETEQAEQLCRDMYKYMTANPTQEARVYMIAMKGAQMVETNTWEA